MTRSLRSKLLAVGVLGAAAGAVIALRPAPSPAADPAATTAGEAFAAEGRAILGHAWFDRLPSSARDDYDVWIFWSAGVGTYIGGSNYRFTIDRFEFERNKTSIELVALHDKKTLRFTFEVKACSDKPPFDLCLHTSEPLRGKKVLYGFGDEEDAAHRFGWFAESRTRATSH